MIGLFSGQSTEDTIRETGFGTSQYKHIGTVAAYVSIYSMVEDYETENKTRVDTEYEREKMAVGSILTSSRYQVTR